MKPTVEDLIKKQIALFRANEIEAERAQRAGRGKEGKLALGPYLLISREKGAGGSAVGQLAAKRLGWHVFDREIVDAIAMKTQVCREFIESLDEHDRESIREVVQRFIKPKPFDVESYVATLHTLLLTLGHQGNVVIVGRGAEYVLPSRFGLRVRLVAPIEARVRRIAAEGNLSVEAARAEVEKSDRERSKLVHRHYGQDLRDPLNHDMTINTAELSIEAATEIVLTALQRKLAVKVSGSK